MSKITKEHTGPKLLSKEQIEKAKERMKYFEKRDENKIKTDKAKNDFESIIYGLRGWLNDDSNTKYFQKKDQEYLLEKLA